MKRRELLLGLCTGVGFLSGCSERENNTQQGAPTTQVETEPSPAETVVHSTTTTTTPSPKSFLPLEGQGWELLSTSDYDWWPIGGTGGIIGKYSGPDGGTFKFLVMRDENNAEGSAHQFACTGWQISFAYNGWAIAASTGTIQETLTEHHPPTMTSSPAPDKIDRVYELLLRSPKLSEDVVPKETTCPYD